MRRVIWLQPDTVLWARWREHISQLFNVHGISDVRQTETHTAEPIVPEPSTLEFELAIEKLKRTQITR